ncbi:MAG: hypothetical protein EBY65_09350, partial [Acidimicrobiia bacterium]|nr:hypothetical protein [Acidimicrobiia bacterium]
IESQTLKLFQVCRTRRLPVVTFFNKYDRPGRDPLELLDEVEEHSDPGAPLTGAAEPAGERRRDQQRWALEVVAGLEVGRERRLDPRIEAKLDRVGGVEPRIVAAGDEHGRTAVVGTGLAVDRHERTVGMLGGDHHRGGGGGVCRVVEVVIAASGVGVGQHDLDIRGVDRAGPLVEERKVVDLDPVGGQGRLGDITVERRIDAGRAEPERREAAFHPVDDGPVDLRPGPMNAEPLVGLDDVSEFLPLHRLIMNGSGVRRQRELRRQRAYHRRYAVLVPAIPVHRRVRGTRHGRGPR